MAKPTNTPQKDMFGQPLRKRRTRLVSLLARIDKVSFASRLERFEFVGRLGAGLWGGGSVETMFVCEEASWAYVSGAYVSTIMLSQAFIERCLHDLMLRRAPGAPAKRSTRAIIQYCRDNQLMSEFLLRKIDRLRQIRNPFAHAMDSDSPFSLRERIFLERAEPSKLLQKDALSLIYALLKTRH